MNEDFDGGLPVIRSRKNDRLRLVRTLGTRRGRKTRGRFLLEGPKPINELLARAPERLEQILYRVDGKVAETLALARAAGVPCYPVAPELFDALAPSETPQPLLAIAPIAWRELNDVVGGPGEAPRAVVACVGVQDPGNLGTILRSARFFGFAGAVVLPGTQDPWSPKVVRSATGALLAEPPARVESLEELLAAAAAAELVPVALAAHEGESPAARPLPARSLLLLGAEGQGLPEETRAVTRWLTIPTPNPAAESLNVAVAFAVMAHAWCAAWSTTS